MLQLASFFLLGLCPFHFEDLEGCASGSRTCTFGSNLQLTCSVVIGRGVSSRSNITIQWLHNTTSEWAPLGGAVYLLQPFSDLEESQSMISSTLKVPTDAKGYWWCRVMQNGIASCPSLVPVAHLSLCHCERQVSLPLCGLNIRLCENSWNKLVRCFETFHCLNYSVIDQESLLPPRLDIPHTTDHGSPHTTDHHSSLRTTLSHSTQTHTLYPEETTTVPSHRDTSTSTRDGRTTAILKLIVPISGVGFVSVLMLSVALVAILVIKRKSKQNSESINACVHEYTHTYLPNVGCSVVCI